MLASDRWRTVLELESDGDPSVAAWRRLRLDIIESIAASSRPSHVCTVNRTRYAAGTTSIATEVVFDDGVAWIFRVRTDHVPDDSYSPESVSRRLACEIATLRLVKERTGIPVPSVYAFCTASENPLGFPYVIMSPVVGLLPTDIGIPLSDPVATDKRHVLETYCASLADIHLQLRSVRAEQIGSVYLHDDSKLESSVGPVAGSGIGPFDTAAAYYRANAERLLNKLRPTGRFTCADSTRAFTFWLYRLLAADAAFSTHSEGPFVLMHTDLHIFNTLVDEVRTHVLLPCSLTCSTPKAGNIVGVLDWESAAFLPLGLFATQMILFNNINFRAFDYAQERFELYNQALELAEQRSSAIAQEGTHDLALLHASKTCRLLGFLHYNHVDVTDFDNENWPRVLCEHLYGTEDWRSAMSAPAFQEWFASQL